MGKVQDNKKFQVLVEKNLRYPTVSLHDSQKSHQLSRKETISSWSAFWRPTLCQRSPGLGKTRSSKRTPESLGNARREKRTGSCSRLESRIQLLKTLDCIDAMHSTHSGIVMPTLTSSSKVSQAFT